LSLNHCNADFISMLMSIFVLFLFFIELYSLGLAPLFQVKKIFFGQRG
jgi:hypothetical protein